MILPYKNFTPELHDPAFIAPNATVIGEVTCEKGSSVWFGAVLRGDSGKITIGEYTNIQDNVTVHNAKGTTTVLGSHISVGHNAVLHGCHVGDHTLIGMHATLLNNCQIGHNCIIAAGALVPENKVIPDGSLVMGVPGKIVAALSPEQMAHIEANAKEYLELAQDFASESGGKTI